MTVALVLSGGTGVRLGADIPKQYIEVAHKPVAAYCLETLAEHARIDVIQIVADAVWNGLLEEIFQQLGAAEKLRGISSPGQNRQISIWNGLQDIRKYAAADDVVLIHDAARPLLKAEQIDACLEALWGHDAVLPVLPMKDTVYYSNDGEHIGHLMERSHVYAGQAPEVFLFEKYYRANEKLFPERILSINGSMEPAVIAGLDILMIPGDEENFKITTKADLARFASLAG